MKNKTRIVIILDRSGSMNSARESTIKGLNTFVSEQKKANTGLYDTTLRVVQFDDNGGGLSYEVIHDNTIREFPDFTQADFVPRGGTPLLDAQGRAITELGEELAKLPEKDRPNKVLVVTITDGYENASKEYTALQIRSMIEHQTKKYNWDFVYLGANQDAVLTGQTFGYQRSKSMTYNVSDPAAVGATYSNLAAYAIRTSNLAPSAVEDNEFTEQERSSSLTGK